jgi:DUF1009 family protein
MRFDIPCIGMQTINRCLESGFRALAFEASKIILLEKEAIEMRLQGEAFSLLAIPESKA